MRISDWSSDVCSSDLNRRRDAVRFLGPWNRTASLRRLADMTDHAEKGLLPAGLQDVLPPLAAHESAVVERLIACFQAQGYERVKPPLLEFEEALLTGAGAAVASQTFRLMDPVSQRMMGLRADMTPQVARIAT